MKIKIGSNAYRIIAVFVLACLHFCYIFANPLNNNQWNYATWIIAIAIYCYFWPGKRKLKKVYPFVSKYITYIIFSQTIICLYSMNRYNETILDMFMCAGGYSMVLLTYPILLSFEKDGIERLLDTLFGIVSCFVFCAVIHSVIYNYTGKALLFFPDGNYRHGNYRIDLSTLIGFFFVYAMYNLLTGRRRVLMLFGLCLGLFSLIYTEMTRANQLAVICTLFIMWFFNKERSTNQIIKFVVAMGALLVFLNSELFVKVISILSIRKSVNSEYLSTLARVSAIEYFSQYTKDNPLIGMGWVRPYTESLTKIWAGPNERAFFDDLGFLGQFFRQGILGAIIYLALIFRMLWVVAKVPKNDPKRLLLIGLCSYVICTLPSLSCFDVQRIIAVPIYLACTEFLHRSMYQNSNLSR